MTKWYRNSWSDIVENLNSDAKNGLSSSQVVQLSENNNKYISNLKGKKAINILWNQIRQIWLILIIMIISFCILLFSEEYISAGIIFILLMGSIFLTFFNEYKDNKRLKELENLSPIYAKVVRDGKIMRISAEELVIGDIVFIDKGESVPADLRIIESENLKVKETAITGEIYISEKYSAKIDDVELSLSEMKNILFKSSLVVSGNGTGIVIAVGEDTQIGNIIKMFIEESETGNSFKTKIYSIINILSIFSIITFLFFLFFGFIAGFSFKKIFLCADLVSISSAPIIGIIDIFLISNIILKNFKKRGTNFKDLSAAYEFTTVDIICFDKIGMLSENEMKVVKIYSDEKLICLDDSSQLDETIYSILKIGLVCNDSIEEYDKDNNTRINIIERAFIKFGKDKNIIKSEIQKSNPRILQIQYDSERDMMTVINKVSDNKSLKFRAYVKGSVESLLSRSTHILKNGIETQIEPEDVENIKNMDNSFCNEGFIVLALAYRNFTYKPSLSENIESNLVFVGITALENPIKDGVLESLDFCKLNNIRTIVMTEDNKLTASAFGRFINLISNDLGVISGVELDNIDNDELKRNIENINIFSKLKPEHKLRIAKVLKDQNHTIAFGGEKLADLPALRSSNISMAVGNKCSNILKNISDISLSNVSLNSLIALFKESNKVILSIYKILTYFFVCNIIQGSFVILGLLFGYNITLKPLEVIWLNLYNIIISSIALLFQSKDNKLNLKSFAIDKIFLKYFINKKVLIEACLIILLSFLTLVVLYNHTSNSSNTAFAILAFSQFILTYSFVDTLILNNLKCNFIIIIGILLQFVLFSIPEGILALNLNFTSWIVIFISLLIEIFILSYIKLWTNIKN